MSYTRFKLSNGLTVIHLPDTKTQLAVINILYKVGSKDESPQQTGFAHLFEHLMFGGSINVPEFDTPLQFAGGENNAFTSNDITNYYLTLPANNIETGFWLESDRMLSLAFSQKSLDVQKGVVIEEFKERYLNQPYGDLWHKLLPLCYTTHPYRWPTIGEKIEHIQEATLSDVKSFFSRYYCPNNAVLVVGGNISLEQTQELCEKWFAPIPQADIRRENYNNEPEQLEPRSLTINADVPLDMLVKAYHTCGRKDSDFFATDLLSDFFGAGRSAYLYNELVKKERIFSELDCYITGDAEPGLLIIEGKLLEGITPEAGDHAVQQTLERFLIQGLQPNELNKLKNKAETNVKFSDMKILNRAMKIAYYEFLGDCSQYDKEIEKYLNVSTEDINRVARNVLKPHNCSTIYYKSTK